MTDTKQTMRDALRQHGLPEAWAEWVVDSSEVEDQEPFVGLRLQGLCSTLDFSAVGDRGPWRLDRRSGFPASDIDGKVGDWFGPDGALKLPEVKPAPRPVPPKPPCYIAGPFRGKSHWDIAQNIRRAEAVALAAWRSGLFSWVYCPHLNTAHFQDAAPDDVWIEGHLEAMRAVHREGGVVVVMNGWDKSSGTRAELEEAHRIGMPVFRYQGDDTDQIAGVKCARRMNRLLTIGGVGLWDFTNDEATLGTYLTERAGRGK